MITRGRAAVQALKKYYCCYIGRKDKHYVHSHDEILSAFGNCLVEHDLNPPVFQQAMGTERYIFRSPNEAEILDIAEFVLKNQNQNTNRIKTNRENTVERKNAKKG
jgi:hypothetical protein